MGYGATIAETVRLTDQKPELTEEERAILDEKLRLLMETGGAGAFTYFLPDERKDGGVCVTTMGAVKKIDTLEGCVVFTDGTQIPIEDILEIEFSCRSDG